MRIARCHGTNALRRRLFGSKSTIFSRPQPGAAEKQLENERAVDDDDDGFWSDPKARKDAIDGELTNIRTALANGGKLPTRTSTADD